MDINDLTKVKVPFKVSLKGSKSKRNNAIVIGFSESDPLSVVGAFGIIPKSGVVYFEKGGWLMLNDFLNNYDLIEN